jgi:flavoprotein hydroxylase
MRSTVYPVDHWCASAADRMDALADRTGGPGADVLVVGYGPVGQVLSILLAQRGWRVVVAEQWPAPYPTPRAVTFDRYAARVLAEAGVADALTRIGEPTPDYVVHNAAGRTLLRIGLRGTGPDGWPDSTSMYQPGLEAALAARAARLPNLIVLRGHRVTGLTDHAAAVEVTAEQTAGGAARRCTAPWVVGCDGANSLVRDTLATPVTDYGFRLDWMACDVTPHEPARFEPCNLQIADPARPRVAVSAGPGHRRWEFMRLPGEPAAAFASAANAWRLLACFGVRPENATLDRHAVYRIRARSADRWRRGRTLIAGDAAHQMPPFAGQGLCSGIRDAANLASKLDLVLRGGDPGLLDTYEAERKPAVRQAIELSVQLGAMICLTDPVQAAERDHAMLAARDHNVAPPR